MAGILQFFVDRNLADDILYISVLSGIASSSWMMRACCRPPLRLLKRQLFHQAAATLIICVTKAALMTWTRIFGGQSDCLGDLEMKGIDRTQRYVQHGLFCASWLVDLHIAASIAAASLRSQLTLARLGRWLPLIWVVAAVYGIEAVVVNAAAGRSDVGRHDYIGAFVVGLIFNFTAGLYLVAVVASRRTEFSGAVVSRMRNRAMVYPLIFVITVFPTLLRYVDADGFDTCSPMGIFSYVLEFSTSTFNALAFCMLSGVPLREQPTETQLGDRRVSVRHVIRGDGNNSAGTARSVAFRDRDSFPLEDDDDAPCTLTAWQAGQWRDRAGSLDEEVAAANRESGMMGPTDEMRRRELTLAYASRRIEADLARRRAGAADTYGSEEVWKEYVGEEEY